MPVRELLGAEFTQVWIKRYGKPIEPEENAIRVVRRLEYVKS
jgi:hypothetical protein